MASIYDLNHPWSSFESPVTGLENHPFSRAEVTMAPALTTMVPLPTLLPGVSAVATTTTTMVPLQPGDGEAPPNTATRVATAVAVVAMATSGTTKIPTQSKPEKDINASGSDGEGRHGRKEKHKGRFGRRGHHGHHGRNKWNNDHQNEDAEMGERAEVESRAETVTPEDQEKDIHTPTSSDSEGEPRHGRKDKHKGRHGAGKAERGGKGCKGRHGHGPGHKGGFGKFGKRGHGGPHGPHAFGFGHPHPHAHPYHMSGAGSEFHGKGHHKGGRHGHGHGMWHGKHHGPGFPGAMRHHHAIQHMLWPFGSPFSGPQNTFHFTPAVDVFDTSDNYIVHVSLPGAKKSDLNLQYDPEESVLRLSGIVHRPGMNEELHQTLAMEERSQEIGAFERVVRLGTPYVPASVLVDRISANLEDGVLVVTIPKEELPNKGALCKEIPINCEECYNEESWGASKEDNGMVLDEHHAENQAAREEEESESEVEENGYVNIPVE
ncbi:hypothetical protein N7478_001272 [Penicillium angulare]|uniref:uncharacterized protein n=1 Tax=Penicillium angulare TaxID=116970 RepID=UPI0025402DC8|nr:uncharacterized protein N7478_001272 [Penicillium angulare]KAJ5292021.1 hypothetical protein N7478_001272 [Penicillium angulare]